MVPRIVYSAQSKLDLREIFEYISKGSKFYAIRQIQFIKYRIKILKTHPLIGRIVPEFEITFIRELIFSNYRVIYMIVSESQIDILTVHHTSKELKITDFL